MHGRDYNACQHGEVTPTVSPSRRSTARPRRARPSARSTDTWKRRGLALLLISAVAGAGYVALKEPFSDAVRAVTLPLRHEDVIRQQARAKGLDPALIAAVIHEESRFRPRTSHAGAEGLMQILPSTGQFIADRSGGTQFELRDLDSPQINIQYGSWYLRYLIQQYGDEDIAVAAYNAGETTVNEWIAAAGGPSEFDVDEDVPFPETRDYVSNVREARGQYRDHYRSELGL